MEIYFIMKELGELVQCITCKEKENMIQKLENKIRHKETKLQRTRKSGLMLSRQLGKKLRKQINYTT